jgi:hypothetical protein
MLEVLLGWWRACWLTLLLLLELLPRLLLLLLLLGHSLHWQPLHLP